MTLPRIVSFSSHLNTPTSLKCSFPAAAVQLVTIISSNPRLGAEEALGVPPFGEVYFDDNRKAHRRYGINLRQGALAVLRPDGYLGFTAELGAAGGEAVTGYLSRFLVSTI
jgi:phenol 2-monooxygenase